MPSMEVIDELDRCKTALQVVAEMQSGGLATLLDLLLDNLDSAIGQVQAQLRQCTCSARPCDLDTPIPLRRGAITVYQRPKASAPGVMMPRPLSRVAMARPALRRGEGIEAVGQSSARPLARTESPHHLPR